ncbi:MAG: hypothetical protein QOJ39_3177, partial [Candidatus Eremiobacteraeota bacterium]|nr:hypothetical protein [Candidatus Eremiobacteraeota bacterium]
QGKRDLALLHLLGSAGPRRAEAAALVLGNIDERRRAADPRLRHAIKSSTRPSAGRCACGTKSRRCRERCALRRTSSSGVWCRPRVDSSEACGKWLTVGARASMAGGRDRIYPHALRDPRRRFGPLSFAFHLAVADRSISVTSHRTNPRRRPALIGRTPVAWATKRARPVACLGRDSDCT